MIVSSTLQGSERLKMLLWVAVCSLRWRLGMAFQDAV
jgi:hypothetical protein